MGTPLQRHPALQPISREHHHELLLCWKIRQGLSQQVNPERIRKYAYWFWRNYLRPHFSMEEKHLFPLLGMEHELVKKALAQHRRLRRLFQEKEDIRRALHLLEEELEAHIRFEERTLLQVIQETVAPEQLAAIAALYPEVPEEKDWKDEFWK